MGRSSIAPMSCPLSLPAVPAELFRVPAHWPRRPTVATEQHGRPVPLAAEGQRKGLDRRWLWNVLSVTKKSPPGPLALCSFLATVPANIHFCFPLPSCSNCPGAGTKGRPHPSPLTQRSRPGPPLDSKWCLKHRSAHVSWCTLSAPPETSDICSRHASQFCILTKSSPQSQRGIEVPPQKPTCEGV